MAQNAKTQNAKTQNAKTLAAPNTFDSHFSDRDLFLKRIKKELRKNLQVRESTSSWGKLIV
jgi:hypothetical protein